VSEWLKLKSVLLGSVVGEWMVSGRVKEAARRVDKVSGQ